MRNASVDCILILYSTSDNTAKDTGELLEIKETKRKEASPKECQMLCTISGGKKNG